MDFEPKWRNRNISHTIKGGVIHITIYGILIAFYQFLNMIKHSCGLTWASCGVPIESYNPVVALFYLVVVSVMYSGYQFVRRRWRYGIGLLIGSLLSIVLFCLSTVIVWIIKSL